MTSPSPSPTHLPPSTFHLPSPLLPRTPQGVLALDSVVTSLPRRSTYPTINASTDRARGKSGAGNFPTLGGTLSGERHERVRAGRREPVAPHVRSAVWFRDRGMCELCGFVPVEGGWELDHVIPWSAGGADTSENLRVLCIAHNQERSNYIDPTERDRRPVTWWCLNCFAAPDEWREWDDPDDEPQTGPWHWDVNGVPEWCPRHGWGRCRVTHGYRRVHELTGKWPSWHRRELIRDEDATIIAFCAHCNRPGMTDVTL